MKETSRNSEVWRGLQNARLMKFQAAEYVSGQNKRGDSRALCVLVLHHLTVLQTDYYEWADTLWIHQKRGAQTHLALMTRDGFCLKRQSLDD